MELAKRPYLIIHNLFALVVTAISFMYFYRYNTPQITLEAVLWGIIIGVSFLFIFRIKELDISIGGIFCTCALFIFKWYYLPIVFIIGNLLYVLLLSLTKGIKHAKNEMPTNYLIYTIANYILIETVCNRALYYFIQNGEFSLDRDIIILILIAIFEAFLFLVCIMINFKEKGYITSVMHSIVDHIKEMYEIYMVSIPFAILVCVMYKDYGFVGLSLAGSFVVILQVAFSKQVKVMEMEQESYVDVLTGAKNKKYYMEQIPDTLDSSCAIFFIDFNGFKKINDTYGHDIGDKIIIHGADILKKSLRDKDEVIRFGGDEFMLLLKDADRAICKNVLARIESLCDEMTYRDGDIELNVSMSIGVSICPEESDSKEILANMADEKMYEAKQEKESKRVSYKI